MRWPRNMTSSLFAMTSWTNSSQYSAILNRTFANAFPTVGRICLYQQLEALCSARPAGGGILLGVPYDWYGKAVARGSLDSIPTFAVDILLAMAQKLSGKGDPFFEGKASVYHEIVSHEAPNEDHEDTSV